MMKLYIKEKKNNGLNFFIFLSIRWEQRWTAEWISFTFSLIIQSYLSSEYICIFGEYICISSENICISGEYIVYPVNTFLFPMNTFVFPVNTFVFLENTFVFPVKAFVFPANTFVFPANTFVFPVKAFVFLLHCHTSSIVKHIWVQFSGINIYFNFKNTCKVFDYFLKCFPLCAFKGSTILQHSS